MLDIDGPVAGGGMGPCRCIQMHVCERLTERGEHWASLAARIHLVWAGGLGRGWAVHEVSEGVFEVAQLQRLMQLPMRSTLVHGVSRRHQQGQSVDATQLPLPSSFWGAIFWCLGSVPPKCGA